MANDFTENPSKTELTEKPPIPNSAEEAFGTPKRGRGRPSNAQRAAEAIAAGSGTPATNPTRKVANKEFDPEAAKVLAELTVTVLNETAALIVTNNAKKLGDEKLAVELGDKCRMLPHESAPVVGGIVFACREAGLQSKYMPAIAGSAALGLWGFRVYGVVEDLKELARQQKINVVANAHHDKSAAQAEKAKE